MAAVHDPQRILETLPPARQRSALGALRWLSDVLGAPVQAARTASVPGRRQEAVLAKVTAIPDPLALQILRDRLSKVHLIRQSYRRFLGREPGIGPCMVEFGPYRGLYVPLNDDWSLFGTPRGDLALGPRDRGAGSRLVG